MSKFITELQVSLTEDEAISLQDSYYTKISHALNQGTGGNIYLWYKRGSGLPITRIQFSFDDATSTGMNDAGYTGIDKNLGEGSENKIYLWYSNDSSESKLPITDINVTTDPNDAADKMTSGWEPVSCELYWCWCKTWIHLWVKREKPTYIEKVMATNHFGNDSQNFKDGYIRLDQNTNREATIGKPIFIWYLPTTDPAKAIRDLGISTNDDQVNNFQAQKFDEVKQELNEGTNGNKVHLWYKKNDDNKNPIMSMTLISNPESEEPFEETGANVIKENINPGNNSDEFLKVAYYQQPTE